MSTYIDQFGKVQHYGPKSVIPLSHPVPSVGSVFQNMRPNLPGLPKYKKGGLVPKTGPAYLHKGEMVIPKHLVSKLSKSLKNEIKNKV